MYNPYLPMNTSNLPQTQMSSTYLHQSPNISQIHPGAVTSPAAFQLSGSPYFSKYDIDPEVSEIHKRYEQEAQEVRAKYEEHLKGHLKLGKRIEELEALLAAECEKSNILQKKLDELGREYHERERDQAQIDQKLLFIAEENRRKDHAISEADLTMRYQQQEMTKLSAECSRLKDEVHRLHEFYENKIHEIDESHNTQIRQCNTQIENYRHQIERLQGDHASQLRELNVEWELKHRRVEEQIREDNRSISELEQSNRKLNEQITKLTLHYEEQIKASVAKVKNEEFEKYVMLKKELEAKITTLEEANASLQAQTEDLISEIQFLERTSNETKQTFEEETLRLKAECNELRNQISILTVNGDKLRGELVNKEGLNNKLQNEVNSLEIEMNRIRDHQRIEIEKLKSDFSLERRSFEDAERSLRARIMELERQLVATGDDSEKLKREFNKMKDMLSGNVSRMIDSTLIDYQTKTYVSKKSYEFSSDYTDIKSTSMYLSRLDRTRDKKY
mgnify:CR=1 FL=1